MLHSVPLPSVELYEPPRIPPMKWGELVPRDLPGSFQQIGDLVPTGGIEAGSGGGGTGGWTTGTLTTTDATPATFEISKMPLDSTLFLSSNISAVCVAEDEYGVFIRNAGCKNNADTVTIMGQIQDAFTIRDDVDWRVDYTITGTKVYLRVYGEAGKTIEWSFKINTLTTIN